MTKINRDKCYLRTTRRRQGQTLKTNPPPAALMPSNRPVSTATIINSNRVHSSSLLWAARNSILSRYVTLDWSDAQCWDRWQNSAHQIQQRCGGTTSALQCLACFVSNVLEAASNRHVLYCTVIF